MSASGSPHGNRYPINPYYEPDLFWDEDLDIGAPRESHDYDPPASFYDDLLRPAVNNDPAFAYTYASPYDMSSSRAQPGRLSNGYVDLTSSHVDLTEPVSPRTLRRKRDSPAAGPSAKRHKRGDGTAAEAESSNKPPAKIEEIDLSQDDDNILDVLQKQREEAIKAQAKPVETITTFNTFNCVICMDRPTDVTATACGHLFCHTCLMEALIAGENRAGPGEQKRSQCPVCRKNISRTRATDVIPLLLKKGLATQPRRKPDAVPAAAAPKVQ
ncbi:hypothetical protein OPT61_g7784 [Boeremia exigua]|uniref:Uncharacterized protein n=1 Tax=Boeremia exigua TaxID=749465 RepID=A0ACC2I160_9PLEO|nr:hypothetical protein OPT61_g7784 [Boeremia exigua]